MSSRTVELEEDDLTQHYAGPSLKKRTAFFVEQVYSYALRHAGARWAWNASVKVLDIGCGLGYITSLVGLGGYAVTGVDVDAKTIEACKQRNRLPNVTFRVSDGEDFDLGEQFDVVISSETLEHVKHPEKILAMMHRHLKPNGVALISTPNGYCLWEIVVSRWLQKGGLVKILYGIPKLYRKLTGSDTPFYSLNVSCLHAHFFTLKRLKKLIADAGFQVTLLRNSDLGILPEWSIFSPLKQLECWLANFVPSWLAGGWLVVARKK